MLPPRGCACCGSLSQRVMSVRRERRRRSDTFAGTSVGWHVAGSPMVNKAGGDEIVGAFRLVGQRPGRKPSSIRLSINHECAGKAKCSGGENAARSVKIQYTRETQVAEVSCGLAPSFFFEGTV